MHSHLHKIQYNVYFRLAIIFKSEINQSWKGSKLWECNKCNYRCQLSFLFQFEHSLPIYATQSITTKLMPGAWTWLGTGESLLLLYLSFNTRIPSQDLIFEFMGCFFWRGECEHKFMYKLTYLLCWSCHIFTMKERRQCLMLNLFQSLTFLPRQQLVCLGAFFVFLYTLAFDSFS